jgi:hypothetical protein
VEPSTRDGSEAEGGREMDEGGGRLAIGGREPQLPEIVVPPGPQLPILRHERGELRTGPECADFFFRGEGHVRGGRSFYSVA